MIHFITTRAILTQNAEKLIEYRRQLAAHKNITGRNSKKMRLLVTFLSAGTLILYGYALAGLGGYLFGKGRMDYIVWGLLLGSVTAAAALYLFKKHPEAFFKD